MCVTARSFYTVFLMFAFTLFSFSSYAQAGKTAQAVKLNAAFSLADTLKIFTGTKKRVSLLLNNGVSYTGVISEVGPNFAVISQLTGKEFFDVLVRLDDVSGLEVQVR